MSSLFCIHIPFTPLPFLPLLCLPQDLLSSTLGILESLEGQVEHPELGLKKLIHDLREQIAPGSTAEMPSGEGTSPAPPMGPGAVRGAVGYVHFMQRSMALRMIAQSATALQCRYVLFQI